MATQSAVVGASVSSQRTISSIAASTMPAAISSANHCRLTKYQVCSITVLTVLQRAADRASAAQAKSISSSRMRRRSGLRPTRARLFARVPSEHDAQKPRSPLATSASCSGRDPRSDGRALRPPARPVQAGRRTSRRSPSSVRLPPIASMTRRAVDAPRSFRSSERTIGAAASGTGAISTISPAATISACSSAPWRTAHRASAEMPTSTGARSTRTVAPEPLATALSPEPLRGGLHGFERVGLDQRRLIAARLDPGRRGRGRRAGR